MQHPFHLERITNESNKPLFTGTHCATYHDATVNDAYVLLHEELYAFNAY